MPKHTTDAAASVLSVIEWYSNAGRTYAFRRANKVERHYVARTALLEALADAEAVMADAPVIPADVDQDFVPTLNDVLGYTPDHDVWDLEHDEDLARWMFTHLVDDEPADEFAQLAHEEAGWGSSFDPADVQWGFSVRTRW